MQSHLPSALALTCLFGGCSELVDLGSECPPNVQVCVDGPAEAVGGPAAPQPVPSAPGAIQDAGGPETGGARDATDATPPTDGTPPSGTGAGANVPSLPALQNRSFELTQGAPGDITAVSLPSFTSISPWYTCQPIGQGSTGPLSAVRAETGLSAGGADAGAAITPTDARTFVSIRYFGNVLQVPLVQRLSTPLQPGTRYGFAVDVRATSETPHLTLQVKGGNDCLGITQQPEVLATSAPIVPGTWQRLCVTFAPSAAYNLVGLQAVSTSPVSDDMLLVDNLREAVDCP